MGLGVIVTPDRANKKFKNEGGYRQMSKNGDFGYFTLLGCKVGRKSTLSICFEKKFGL